MNPRSLPHVMTGEQAKNEPIMQVDPHLVFRTDSHPAANGRIPAEGEKLWAIRFPLEDGRILEVQTGWDGLSGLIAMCEKIQLEESLAAMGIKQEAHEP